MLWFASYPYCAKIIPNHKQHRSSARLLNSVHTAKLYIKKNIQPLLPRVEVLQYGRHKVHYFTWKPSVHPCASTRGQETIQVFIHTFPMLNNFPVCHLSVSCWLLLTIFKRKDALFHVPDSDEKGRNSSNTWQQAAESDCVAFVKVLPGFTSESFVLC